MKQPIWLGVAILLAWHAQAGDAPSSFLSGERNVYLHVVLEKANGEDIRARTIPQATIAKAEAEGKQMRPTRDTQYVESYWAFLADGSYKTFEYYNYGPGPPQATALTYEELEKLFATIRPLTKWRPQTGVADVQVGGAYFSMRVIEADEPGGAGKKGEIEIGWLEGGKPIYFYYCLPVVKK